MNAHTLTVNGTEYTADHIVISTGSRPIVPTGIPGAEFGITSDGFFELEQQPQKVAVVGGGYIALELAGVLNALGTETHMLHQGFPVLIGFDSMVQTALRQQMQADGIIFNDNDKITQEKKQTHGQLTLHYADSSQL